MDGPHLLLKQEYLSGSGKEGHSDRPFLRIRIPQEPVFSYEQPMAPHLLPVFNETKSDHIVYSLLISILVCLFE